MQNGINDIKADNTGNPGNSGNLAPHGGCWWDGCKTCNPDKSGTSEEPVKRVRRHQKSLDAIKHANSGKIRDWHELDDPSQFVTVAWGNVQIDPSSVKAGDKLLLALKEDVLVGSKRTRLIARWIDITVRTPDMCIQDDLWHAMSVCTECIRDSWLWDFLFRNVRTLPGFAHGTNRAYDVFGCRCDDCTRAHSALYARRAEIMARATNG